MPKISALGNVLTRPKSLRFKVVTIIGGVFLALFLTQFIVVRFLMLRNYDALEHEQTKLNTERLRNTLAERLAKLDSHAVDYAQWDDTYAFTQNRDPRFLVTGLSNAMFSNLNINLFAILDAQGQVLVKKHFDLATQRYIPLPKEIDQLLTRPSALHSTLVEHPQLNSKVMGLVSTTVGPLIDLLHESTSQI